MWIKPCCQAVIEAAVSDVMNDLSDGMADPEFKAYVTGAVIAVIAAHAHARGESRKRAGTERPAITRDADEQPSAPATGPIPATPSLPQNVQPQALQERSGLERSKKAPGRAHSIDILQKELDQLRTEVEWWKSAHDTCCAGADRLAAQVEQLRKERVEGF